MKKMGDINSCNIQKLENLLAESLNPVITTHMKPDGDAIGSCTALYHFLLSAYGKRSRIILNDRYPGYLDFLASSVGEGDIIIYEEDKEKAASALTGSDLIFCLDFNAFHRTDNLEHPLEAAEAPKILIDHHLNPAREKFSLSFSETGISSASELLYQILMATSYIAGDASRLPAPAVMALMTGMTTDTNNFANSVYPSTLEMASALLSAGADRDYILDRIYNQYRENRLRLMGHMMKDLLRITDDGVAYIVLNSRTQEEYDVEEGDTEGFVNMPLSIASVRMSLLLKEASGHFRVSIRSKKGTSANRCAMLHFNGGGHENAAGGRLRIPEDIASPDKAAEYIELHTHLYLTENEKDI